MLAEQEPAAVYAVAYQELGTNKGLVAAKARLAEKGLTISRLELVAGHVAANLVDNVRNVLEGCAVRSVYGWTDSMVAVEQEDSLEQILQKHGFWQTICITSWVARFIHNCNCKYSKESRLSGTLTTGAGCGEHSTAQQAKHRSVPGRSAET